MHEGDDRRLTEAEAISVLESLFPEGPVGTDVTAELTADGWTGPPGDLTLADSIGTALWDVFSDNHDVLAPDGRVVALGSWRGSGDTIAEFLNGRVPGCRLDYMDFYMGSRHTHDGATWGPLHRLVFRRLRDRGFDWRYAFPQLFVIDVGSAPRDDPAGRPDWEGYAPDAALRREAEDAERERERDELAAELADAQRKDVEEALCRPPPSVVAAYRTVYGHDPTGWPPE